MVYDQAQVWRVLGSIPGKGNLERAIFCLLVPVNCCTHLRFFGVVSTCQVLRILKLPRRNLAIMYVNKMDKKRKSEEEE